MNQLLFYLTIGLLSLLNLQAQSIEREVIGAAGDYFKNDQVSLNWTLGEVAVEQIEGKYIVLQQGFHQPQSDLSTTIQRVDLQEMGVTVYPNPTHHFLQIQTKEPEAKNLKIQLLDLQGKVLIEEPILKTNITLDLEEIISGQYLLKFTDRHQQISTLKIIKQ